MLLVQQSNQRMSLSKAATKSLNYLNYKIHYLINLPIAVRTKIEHGIRTAYTYGLFCLLFNYWSWSGSLTFFSGIFALIAHSLYIGQWINSSISAIFATFVGASLGTLSGFAWKVGPNGSLQLFLMFISLTIINRVSLWDRYSKVLGSITCFLAAMLPNVWSGRNIEVTGSNSMEAIMLMVFVPVLLTGFAILFPIPGLASKKAIKVICKLNKDVNAVTSNLVQAFYDLDMIEVYLTQNEVLFQKIETSIETLTLLSRLSHFENYILFIGSLSHKISNYHIFISRLVIDLKGIQMAMKSIPINVTQLKFAQHMKEPLNDMSRGIECILTNVLNKYMMLSDFNIYSCKYWYNILTSQPTVCYYKNEDICNSRNCIRRQKLNSNISQINIKDNDNNIKNDPEAIGMKTSTNSAFEGDCICQFCDAYIGSMQRLNIAKEKVLSEYLYVRQNYLFDNLDLTPVHQHGSIISNENINNTIETRSRRQTTSLPILHQVFTKPNSILLKKLPSQGSIDINQETSSSNSKTTKRDVSDLLFLDEKILKRIIHHENEHLAIRNVSARCAYICRFVAVITMLDSDIMSIFTAVKPVYSFRNYMYKTYLFLKEYFTWFFILESYTDKLFLRSMIQPMKIAGAITITALFVVDAIYGFDNGLWAGVTLCFIRQESSASSFLTSYNRLEGNSTYTHICTFPSTLLSHFFPVHARRIFYKMKSYTFFSNFYNTSKI